MRDMLQKEFPFTSNGALDAYNHAQREHINKEYRKHFMEEKNPHYIMKKDDFIHYFITQGGAHEFSKKHSHTYFQHAVERYNDEVWDAWIDNKLFPEDHPIYKRLDHVLNEGEVDGPATRICRNGRQVWLKYH